jgi:hypothetical protein
LADLILPTRLTSYELVRLYRTYGCKLCTVLLVSTTAVYVDYYGI